LPPERPEAAFDSAQPVDHRVNIYAMAAQRHMHEYGTTPEQLAWVKVAASLHAQHNPHALLRKRGDGGGRAGLAVIADPLHQDGLLRHHRRWRRAGRHRAEIARS
jgi:acetyl-CoA C-acetyltransferase